MLKTTAIQPGLFLPEQNKQLPAALTPRPQIEVRAGDILLTCAGPRSRCGIACLVRNTRKKLMISGKMYRFRVPDALFEPRYLEAFLQTATARDAIDRMKTGGSDSGLNLTHDRFRQLEVPVAPLNEQRRIAETYEELISDLDAGVAALERTRDKLKVYRVAVLKAAVEGALTSEWREQQRQIEPASELLKRILAERRQHWEEEQLRKFEEKEREPPKNWKAKYKEPVAPNATGLPPLPEGWCWATIDQLIREPLRNGHSAKTVTVGTGVPAFSLSAVTDGDFSDSNVKQTAADPEKVRDLWVETDDIFVERSNTPELVGTTRRYRGEPSRAIFPDLLIRVRVAASIPAAFVEICLQSSRCRTYFQKRAQGISGSMPKIDQEAVECAAVPLPSIAEQEAIVEATEDQLSVIDHLESNLDAKLKNAQGLRQSLLRRAFSGKLVPQDPNDEPASELLKRIAAEREQRARAVAAAKRLNGQKLRHAAKPRGKAARAKTAKKETGHGRIADR
jgi:type I restriction enzyme S subunit